MRKSFCIICGKEKNGIEVQNDTVLSAIRWFKRNVTKNEQNNKLVVCKEDYQTYATSRRKFESRQRLYTAFGVLFLIITFIASPRLSTLAVSAFMMLFLMLFPFLSYMPKINISIKNPHKQ